MGGSGVINLELLHEHKQVFGLFAQQLTYPQKLDFLPLDIDDWLDSAAPAYDYIQKYWSLMQEYSLEQIEELYPQTFDFQKEATLYMTYFKFEDSKERGQMLVKLKIMYQMFGLDMPEQELSDYLPLMCEFIYAAEWRGNPHAARDFEVMIGVIEDGTYHLLQALEKWNSPYYNLIKAIRETLKACIEQEANTHEHV